MERRVTATGAVVDIAVTWTREPAIPTQILPYAMRLYFANGGGPCYVYSLGPFGKPARKAFTDAIVALQAVDEPTLLVFPGAVSLGGNVAYGNIVDAALASCRATEDRFAIADVKAAVRGGTDDNTKVTANFRNRILRNTSEFLKYGAAYFPYLVTTLPLRIADDHVTLTSFTRVVLDGAGNKFRVLRSGGRPAGSCRTLDWRCRPKIPSRTT